MADESPTADERREAVDAYTRDMHAYTFRLWTEVRREAEQKALIEEASKQQGKGGQGGRGGGGKQTAAQANTASKTR